MRTRITANKDPFYAVLLLDKIDNEILTALSMGTPSKRTPRATKKLFNISEQNHCIDKKKTGGITLNNFKIYLLLETKSHLPSREYYSKNGFENHIVSLKN